MLIGTRIQKNTHTRNRRGLEETVATISTVYILRCDCCGNKFERSSKQYQGGYSHVCCDKKQFAGKVSKYSKIDASSTLTI
tara:strand:+ start:355 stop:597 length:243 start_codon:yes stop_codon:yes gene_type:complete